MSITLNDFQKLSLKTGKITTAERIQGISKLMKVNVDIGDRVAQAIIGGAKYYEPKNLEGKRVIVVTNMEPKTIAGVRSEVMLLAADLNGRPVWLTVDEDVPVGTTIR